MTSGTHRIPRVSTNLYGRSAIDDPYPVYRRLRQAGPVVHLTRHRALGVTTYDACRQVLLDDDTFVSGDGVGMNALVNRLGRRTTLNSDGKVHADRRKLVAHRLMPRALKSMHDAVHAAAAEVAEAAVRRGRVDGVADIARALPLRVVPDLVGWPADERKDLLPWAAATFDVLGPWNGATLRAAPASVTMLRFAKRIVRTGNVIPGSLGADVLAAVDDGVITRAEASALLVDYLAPSLDTTISAISSALLLFARHPDQWEMVRADPSLMGNAVNEVVRFESPLRAFSRRSVRDTVIEDVGVPAGSRVVVIYASANRDERTWTDPDVFDIRRDAGSHLGFGRGTHSCAGQGLARLESTALLAALAERVARIELVDVPRWGRNNIIRGLSSLPLHLHADRRL
jgi:cytochrome P450